MMTSPPSGTSAYQCAICKEQYSRPDHLVRHVRTHTKQRPFRCNVCNKAFGRKDLLKRHSLAHHNPDLPVITSQDSDNLADSGKHGPRVRQACRTCAQKKLKCTDSKPCRRCTERNLSCEYDQTPPNSPQDQTSMEDQMPIDVEDDSVGNEPVSATRSNPELCDTAENLREHRPQLQPNVENTLQAIPFVQSLVPGESALRSSQMENLSSPHEFSSLDVLGCTFDLPSFGDYIQQDADLNFGDLNLPMLPPDFIMTPEANSINYSSWNSTTLQSQSPVTGMGMAMGMGTEAYQGSYVRRGWIPGLTDTNSETESLEFPLNVRSEVLSTIRNSRLAMRKDDITISTRDKILAMIYSRTCKSIWSRMSTTFEMVDVLKTIAHHALLHMQEQQMVSFIHLPSFDLNAQRPELLGALLAYGAVNLPSPPMRKFGYGLQELVRLAVNQKLEEERASVRDLGVAQAYYIQLHLGFWSGISAKIEVAESSSMLGITMLRRGKMFQAGNYQPPQAFLSLDNLSLHQKWSRWIAQESWRRLVCFAMLCDAGVSLARNINPLIAYSEIATPLPATTRLWEASTAEAWHEILMQDSQLRLTQGHPIRSLLREPRLIRAEQNIVDSFAAAATILAGYWALVYEYRQMEALQSGVQDWNNFVLRSRQTELMSLLDQLKMELSEFECLPVQVVLLQELILLHLNAAYYEISAYSGRGTMEDAQAAKAYVEWWFESQHAHHAIWHAGQILRLTKTLKPGTLSDISVIAIYHATETMWVWGLMQRTRHVRRDAGSILRVFLDQDEAPAVTKFLRMSRGDPGVTNLSNQFVPLTEPASVSDLANDIIKRNWGIQIQPWTTSEVSRLVQGFSKICRRTLAEREI